MSLLSRVMEVERFVALAKSAMGDGGVDAVGGQVEHIVETVAAADLPLSEAVEVLEQVRMSTCPLSPADVNRVVKAVNKKLAAGPSGQRLSDKRQLHSSFFNYMEKGDWLVLMDERAAVETRLEALVNRAMSIGLLYPSEPTVVGLLSVVAVAGKELWSHDVTHMHLIALKQLFRSRRKAKILHEGEGVVVKKFPLNASDWVAKQDCVGDYTPIACPISISLIAQRQSTMAARKSHTTLKAKPSEAQVGGSATERQTLADIVTQAAAAAAATVVQSPRHVGDDHLRVASPMVGRQQIPPPTPLLDAALLGDDKPPTPTTLAFSPRGSVASPTRTLSLVTSDLPPSGSIADDGGSGSSHDIRGSMHCMESKSDVCVKGGSRAPSSDAGGRAPGSNDLDKVLADWDAIIAKRTAKRKAGADEEELAPAPKRRKLKKTTDHAILPPTIASRAAAAGVRVGEKAPDAACVGDALVGDASVASVDEASVGDRPPMMATGAAAAIVYKGCKIYSSVKMKAWRVYPFPNETVYDKRFRWSCDPISQWEKVLKYCESPTLPETRKKEISHFF